jgi:3D (Asp-Asp-Asp) domain-containing protein
MGTVPLHSLLKILRADRLVMALCIAASITGAGFAFMGGLLPSVFERPVTLESPSVNDSFFTEAATVGDFLHEIGIEFSEYDLIDPAPGTPIRPGLTINYSPAKRVFLADGGSAEEEVMCTGETVCDLLTDQGISAGPLDRVRPHPATPLEDDMHVVVTRVDILDVTTSREIEPPLAIEPDPDMPRGHMEEVSAGSPGVEEDVTRYYYRNGEQTAQVDLGSRVVTPPQQRVARVGVRSSPPLASRSGAHRDVMSMVATGYDPGVQSCWPYADGRTATGRVAGRGVCAVDPNVIPLGTELWIEGYGYALACDTGGAIQGNRIDVCFDTRSEAIQWGRRTVLVYILD